MEPPTVECFDSPEAPRPRCVFGCEPWARACEAIPTLGVPGRGLRIGGARNTGAPARLGVRTFLWVRRASQFDIAKAAMYGARFVHTAENEKQLKTRDFIHAAMLDRPTIAEIKALGAKLARFSGGAARRARHGHGFFKALAIWRLLGARQGRDLPNFGRMLIERANCSAPSEGSSPFLPQETIVDFRIDLMEPLLCARLVPIRVGLSL